MQRATMECATIEALARASGRPAVSMVCPLDTRRPGNTEDPLRLAELRAEAAVLLAESANGEAPAILRRVDDAIASIDLEHPMPAVGIFVTADESHVLMLGVPMPARVVVDETFALRDVVTAVSRATRVRILALSRARTRCFDLSDVAIVERDDFGFPVQIAPPIQEDTPHRDLPIGEHEHDEVAKQVFRAVIQALDHVQHADPRPLVLLGPERDLAYFDAVARLEPAAVMGRAHGNYDRETAAEIAELARPVVDAAVHAREAVLVAQVHEAIGRRALSGFDPVWDAARTGRGHRLVVEEGYARGDPLVREVVLHGGEVDVVSAGTLADLGHVALFLRY